MKTAAPIVINERKYLTAYCSKTHCFIGSETINKINLYIINKVDLFKIFNKINKTIFIRTQKKNKKNNYVTFSFYRTKK